MPKNSFISNFRWALLAVGVFFAFDYALSRSAVFGRTLAYYSDVAFDNPFLLYEKLARVRHEPGKRLVVIMGSSVARESIDEKLLQTELGPDAQVMNLGFFHGRAVDFWMISDSIRALKPDLVLLPVLHGEFYLEYSYQLTFPYYFYAGKMFALTGGRDIGQHWREYLYALLGRASFIFRYRDTIASGMLRGFENKLGLAAWHQRGPYRFVNEQEFLPDWTPTLNLFGQPFEPDPGINGLAMEKLLQSFSREQIPVRIVRMASHPKFLTIAARAGKVDFLRWREVNYPEMLAEWSKIPGVGVVEPPSNLVPNSDFADYIHLNARGRAVFSHWIGGWLEQNQSLWRMR